MIIIWLCGKVGGEILISSNYMEGDLSSVKLYLVRWIWKFIPDSRGHNLKSSLLRWAGAKVGKNVEIMSSAKVIGNFNLFIGDGVFIGHEALIFGPKGSHIVIEDYAKLGSRTIVVTGTHRFSPDGNCIEKEGTFEDVRICSGAVCSTHTVVLPGKTVGRMSHAAAGSVITKDVPEYTRVAGVPAKVCTLF